MEEKKEGEKERGGSTKLKEEKGREVEEIMRQQKNDINENTVKANNLLFVILTELRIA